MNAELHNQCKRLKHFALAVPTARIFAVVLPLPVSAAQVLGTSSPLYIPDTGRVIIYNYTYFSQ